MSESGPKYPDIEVKLVGTDGNTIALLGKVLRVMRKGKVPAEEIDAYQKEALSGDYNHFLATTMNWVEVY